MIPFHKFEKIFNNILYSINEIDSNIIISSHKDFTDEMIECETTAIDALKESIGKHVPDDVINIIRGKSNELDLEYENIMLQTLEVFLEETFANARLDNGGICLLSKLIGKACQIIHNEDMLGVIRNVDEKNNRFIFVDFGDESEVKIDIDELNISGQKI